MLQRLEADDDVSSFDRLRRPDSAETLRTPGAAPQLTDADLADLAGADSSQPLEVWTAEDGTKILRKAALKFTPKKTSAATTEPTSAQSAKSSAAAARMTSSRAAADAAENLKATVGTQHRLHDVEAFIPRVM